MDYVRFGTTGLQVSRLCLGCMTYGDPGWREWVLDEAAARPFIREAWEAGINFFDTADMYSLGRQRGGARPGAEGAGAARRGRDRDQGVQPDGPAAEPEGPVAQAHHGGDRRLAEAPRHGLCRPLHHPPLRPGHADRGDGRGAVRRGEGRQGALSRRLLDVGLAVHEDAGPAARQRPCPLRLDAELRQPGLPRGGARDAAPCAGPRASR